MTAPSQAGHANTSAEAVLMVGGDHWTSDDIAYATGYGDALVYLETDKKRIVVTYPADLARAQRLADVDEVWVDSELRGPGGQGLFEPSPEDILVIALESVRRAGVSGVLVPHWFPLATADFLRGHGITVRVDTGSIAARRRRKSAREIEAIEKALRVTEQSLSHARSILAAATVDGDALRWQGEPLTSERLQRQVRAFWASRGCEGETPIIAGGPQGALINEAGHGPLRAGEPILFDLFPRTPACATTPTSRGSSASAIRPTSCAWSTLPSWRPSNWRASSRGRARAAPRCTGTCASSCATAASRRRCSLRATTGQRAARSSRAFWVTVSDSGFTNTRPGLSRTRRPRSGPAM